MSKREADRRDTGDAATRDASVALITGASRGFGLLVAVALAGCGWQVFATMRDESARAALDEGLLGAGVDPGAVVVLPLDVTRSESIDAAVSAVLARAGGRLDAVVANAGVFAAGAFEDTPAAVMRELMETNYFGVVETVRATLPALRAARGRIVVISSDSGLCGTPALSGYTASKYAVEGWGESLSYELRPLGVTVSLVEPGPFRTGLFAGAQVHRGAPGSPYAALADITTDNLRSMETEAPDPGPVVAAVLKALTAQTPRLRYPVGGEARRISAGRRFLPQPLFARALQSLTGTRQWQRGP